MKKFAALLAALAFIGAGCAQTTTPPTNQPATNATVNQTEDIAISIDGSWKLTKFTPAGKPAQDVSAVGATMSIEPGARLNAKVCNSMGGEYDIAAGVLKVEKMESTLMLCTGPAGDVEPAFTQALSAGVTTALDGDTLTLKSASGDAFTFERSGDTGRIGSIPEDEDPGEDRTYAGTVSAVDLEHMKVDGPARITVKTASGNATVLVPSMGLNFCKAKASIADVYALKVGDKVEARGSIGSEKDSVVPCESAAHYLKVTK